MDIFLIVFIIIAIAGWFIIQKDNKKISVILKKQASQRNGVVKSVFASYPKLSFPYEEVEIFVSAMGGDARENGPQTYAMFYTTLFPDRFTFRIRGKSMQTIMEKLIGLKEININQPEFDNRFFIRGKDEVFIRYLLTPDIQTKLFDINKGHGLEASFLNAKFFDGSQFIEKPRFNISIRNVSTEDQDYERLIEAAVLFYEQMKKLTTN